LDGILTFGGGLEDNLTFGGASDGNLTLGGGLEGNLTFGGASDDNLTFGGVVGTSDFAGVAGANNTVEASGDESLAAFSRSSDFGDFFLAISCYRALIAQW
jgi:hypothetical protein